MLHTARVREDWQGGKNDLRVRQGEPVEIVRVKNNPEGRWLARNMSGECRFLSQLHHVSYKSAAESGVTECQISAMT